MIVSISALPHPPLLDTRLVQQAVAHQFFTRPGVRSVVGQLLLDQLNPAVQPRGLTLQHTYAVLTVGPDATPLAQPRWRLLLDLLLEHIASQRPLVYGGYTVDECFIAVSTIAPGPATVWRATEAMSQIAPLLQNVVEVWPLALQAALVTYWNQPADAGMSRLDWLAQIIRDRLLSRANTTPGLSDEQRGVLREVFSNPDRLTRLNLSGLDRRTRVYTVAAKRVVAGQTHEVLSPDVLIVHPASARAGIFYCTADGRIEVFSSLTAFTRAWGQQLTKRYPLGSLTRVLYEPESDFLVVQAMCVLERHLAAIMAPRPALSIADLELWMRNLTDTATLFMAQADAEPVDLAAVHAGLPPWLRGASAADRLAYRSHLIALASAFKHSKGRRFNDDVPDLRSFAIHALRQQMNRDQPLAPGYDPDDILLTFVDPVGPGAGGIGTLNPYTLTLTELALVNLGGARSSQMTIRHARGQLIQDWWLTPGYIRQLIQAVDIGRSYPQWIKSRLLDDAGNVQHREQLFTEELRVQLPLQALECKLRQRGHVTEKGCRYIAALMSRDPSARKADGQTIVIRPLAFTSSPSSLPDVVRNMFVIGPLQVGAGPHVLYRPLHQQPLEEFVTWAALRTAIALPGALQQSVLDWLPSAARRVYEAAGFDRLHLASGSVHEDFTLPVSPGRAELSTFALRDNFPHTLYTDLVLALGELADRQTVSNAEQRWMSLLDGGWLLFSTLTLIPGIDWPPLVRMLNAVLLTVTAMTKDIEGLHSADENTRTPALIDLLFNIALTLLHVAPNGDVPLDSRLHDQPVLLPVKPAAPRLAPEKKAEIEVKEGAIFLPSVPVGNHTSHLDFAWFASPRNQLTPSHLEWLDRNRGAWSETRNRYLTYGPYKGLYVLNNQWHAQVDGFSYRVEPELDGVVVVNPRDPSDRGPRIVGDAAGVWRFDTGVKLRGGGPKTRLEAKSSNRIKQLTEMRKKIVKYQIDQDTWQQQLETEYDAWARVKAGQGGADVQTAALERYVALVERQKPDYQAALQVYLQKQALLAEEQDHVMLTALYSHLVRLSCVLYDARLARVGLLQGAHPQVFKGEGFAVNAEVLNSPAYRADCLNIYNQLEKGANDFKDLDGYLEKLREVPRSGYRAAQRLREIYVAYVADGSKQYRSDVICRAHQLVVLRDLITPRLGGEEWAELLRILKPLFYTAISQSELEDAELFSDSERSEILTDIRERYARADDALGIWYEAANAHLELLNLDVLNYVLKALDSKAEAMLADLSRVDSQWLPAQPAAPRTPHYTRKIVRTRSSGILIGTPRAGRAPDEGEIVDVGDRPATPPGGDAGASSSLSVAYKQAAPDQWVEVESARAAPVRPFATLKPYANAVLEGAPGQLRRVKGYAKRSKFPLELYEILDRYAQRLEQLGLEIKAAVPDLAAVEKPRAGTPQALLKRLETAAATLRAQGVALLLSLPPATATVEFLLQAGQVHIEKINQRIAMTGERQDFVQEYEVRNAANDVVWYAHLHYPDAQGPADHPSAAHFKLPGQRMDSRKSLEARARPGARVPEVYYGKISEKMLRERFLQPHA